MMRVFLIGGSSFLGRRVLEILVADGPFSAQSSAARASSSSRVCRGKARGTKGFADHLPEMSRLTS